MPERPSFGVGLMSGTSLDGMDAALVRFRGPNRAELVSFVSRAYSVEERDRLESAILGGTPASLARLHSALGHWAADAVQMLLEVAGVAATEIDFIAFPGQTIWHEPPVVSWQLGEPAILAEQFGVRVVSSFRSRDVAAGGQGAPLVPMADVLLFGADQPRILLNIGGMANLTYVGHRDVEDGAFAFDTGPGMAIIDAAARMVRPDLQYDLDGQVSLAGTVHQEVLADLLAAPFFQQPPPKSTGREIFGTRYATTLVERLPGPDAVATAVALTARSIADAVHRWTPAGVELVVSGGGARHPGLVGALGALLGRPLRRFDDLFFAGDAKEAVAFALLGYLTVHGQPGNLPGATGAAGRRVLGTITPA
ncbi:MAG: anhydro-N-acetylmuramic acid kinase [Gemmatimonadota bacterium]